jgi:hypothetical protein
MFYLVKDDIGTQLKATITRDDTGLPVDLTDATVRLKVRKRCTTTVLFTLTSIAPGQEPAQGGAIFAFNDLDVPLGIYEGEIEATFTDGRIETVYEVIEFTIRNDF